MAFTKTWRQGLVLVTLLLARTQLSAQAPLFAAQATAKPVSSSPDGKSTVTLRIIENSETFETEVQVRTGTAALTTTINFGLNTELLWSGDSKALAITGSSAGANGAYNTEVLIIASDRLIRVPLTQLIKKTFGHPVKCGWPESPNVAAVRWLKDSKTLLVAAEIVHHSNCDSYRTFKAYVVDIRSKRVMKTLSQLQVKKLYLQDLGPELRDANDSCVNDPFSCYVLANHPELK